MRDPADTLREAAKLMRQQAEVVTPSPWHADFRESEGLAWIDVPGWGHAWAMHGFLYEARHVASWHPAVAVAVADWLLEASVEGGISERRCALAVARAYLGEIDDA